MPTNLQIELDNIIDSLKGDSSIEAIYLFGSYAYGEPNEDSDFDIAVITKEKDEHKLDLMKKYWC